MNKRKTEKAIVENVINEVDACLSQCLIDIPMAIGGGNTPKQMHDRLVNIIIQHIKDTHTRYIVEDE